MTVERENTEQLILHAIDVWNQEMKQLFTNESCHPCPYCPKRFIYGCFCSFERKHVEETITMMIVKGVVRKHELDGRTEDYYLQKTV